MNRLGCPELPGSMKYKRVWHIPAGTARAGTACFVAVEIKSAGIKAMNGRRAKFNYESGEIAVCTAYYPHYVRLLVDQLRHVNANRLPSLARKTIGKQNRSRQGLGYINLRSLNLGYSHLSLELCWE